MVRSRARGSRALGWQGVGWRSARGLAGRGRWVGRAWVGGPLAGSRVGGMGFRGMFAGGSAMAGGLLRPSLRSGAGVSGSAGAGVRGWNSAGSTSPSAPPCRWGSGGEGRGSVGAASAAPPGTLAGRRAGGHAARCGGGGGSFPGQGLCAPGAGTPCGAGSRLGPGPFDRPRQGRSSGSDCLARVLWGGFGAVHPIASLGGGGVEPGREVQQCRHVQVLPTSLAHADTLNELWAADITSIAGHRMVVHPAPPCRRGSGGRGGGV